MSSLSADDVLKHVAYHVFMPPKLPQEAPSEDSQSEIDLKLAQFTMDAIEKYQGLCAEDSPTWKSMQRMLNRVARDIETPATSERLAVDMAQMSTGDVLAFYVREQNAAVIVRKNATDAIFEIFEVQSPNVTIMSIAGKLVRQFPDSATSIPNSVFQNLGFLNETCNFLVRMSNERLDGSTAKTTKAGSRVSEVRDSADPHYITQLFRGIVCGMGQEIEPTRVVKRIGDEILWNDAYLPWRRSPVWLVIRVALQTSLSSLGEYKHFMLFMHIHLLRKFHQKPSFSSDLLFTIRVKMARRLLKVKDSAPSALVQMAHEIATRIQEVLQARWTRIQNEIPKVSAIHIDFDNAVLQSLPNAQSYLKKILQGQQKLQPSPAFSPNHSPRLGERGDFREFQNGALEKAFAASRHIALFDFESAVFESLSTWVDNNLHDGSACIVIYSSFEQYVKIAFHFYSEDPADRSIMILAVMALWTALDRLVSAQHALLLEYSPEIPENLIDDLLLRSSQHLEQAKDIQLYLRRRHDDSKRFSRTSIFSSIVAEDSLSVRFFDQSRSLQELMTTIRADAQQMHDQKITEMNQKNDEHAAISRKSQYMECACLPKQKGRKKELCERCTLQRFAKKMRIEVYEWPLPSNEPDAKAVLFELRCPDALNLWRSGTYSVLYDLAGSSQSEQVEPYCTLDTYVPLARRAPPTSLSFTRRITIASSTKPFLRSHYAKTKIPATADSVCVKNGLSFQLFDLARRVWAVGPFYDRTFTWYGTFNIPDASPYHYLQHTLQGTSHSSNQVLADQSHCPQDISLHEHYAFGTLRSGPRLQWINILRGLEENILSFNRPEVELLHSQAAWQVGPLLETSQTREWHVDLEEPEYGRLLVAGAARVLSRVRGNWLESTSIRTIAMLITRLLASTRDREVQQEAYQFLREARRVTFKWLQKLLVKLRDAELVSQVRDYQQRICEMAAICRSTYDVDMCHFPKLFVTTKDYDVVIFCSVILYDNQPSEFNQLSPKIQVLICRDRRFAHRITPAVLKVLNRMPRLIDGAVLQYWNSYRPSSLGWTSLGGLNSRWVTTSTESTPEQNPHRIHIDLLQGRLLLDGKPLGRLPRKYVSHPTYTRLFGQKILYVAPSSFPEMEFTSQTLFEGNKVSLRMDNSTEELVVQARTGNATFQLIPHTILADDFPLLFSGNYHHWINTETGDVEFRPLAAPWHSSNLNWWLRPTAASSYILQKHTTDKIERLVDVYDQTFKLIADQLSPLEDSRYIHITFLEADMQTLFVELPRLKLTFFLNEHQRLESCNFSGCIIDDYQSVGTMFGLRNQLVLCAKDLVARSLPLSRFILIPFGQVNFDAHAGHSRISVDLGSRQHINFYRYKVDSDLGCLRGSVSLTSRLYKIYLHALTSHCLPDPLTGRTGTEEALYEVWEPATSSFDGIDAEQAQLLKLISELTPKWNYYPANLQSMLKTDWLNLPSLSQHYMFATIADSLLNRACSLQLFNASSLDVGLYRTEVHPLLLERAVRRSWIYYPVDTIQHSSATLRGLHTKDKLYDRRHSTSDSWTEDGQAAAWASTLVNRIPNGPIYTPCDLVSIVDSWKNVLGPSQNLELTYSSDWLSLKLPDSWITVYNLCRQAILGNSQYNMATSLVVAVYSGRLPKNMFLAALAVASNREFLDLSPPTYASYQLLDGYKPTDKHVQALLLRKAHNLSATPANDILQHQDESTNQWSGRQSNHYNSNVSRLVNEISNIWMNSWPEFIPIVNSDYSLWFAIQNINEEVELYFESCFRNQELRSYLQIVQGVLAFAPPTEGLEFSPRAPGHSQLKQRPSYSIAGTQMYLGELMQARNIFESTSFLPEASLSRPGKTGPAVETIRLKALLSSFRKLSSHPLHQQYAADLEASRNDLRKLKTLVSPNQVPSLQRLRIICHQYYTCLQARLLEIQALLSPQTPAEHVVLIAGIWPRVNPRSILGRLALWVRPTVPPAWLEHILGYARVYIEYQRSQRLIGLAIESKWEEFYKELDYVSDLPIYGSKDPDWLLVQIDGNFSIRSVQTQVANEMILPSLEANTILQLNMGEGKSSVIVPVVAASLANGSQLVRVIVLKPLWRQMFHLLVNRLAGLAHRRIYYLPFGRHLQVDNERAGQIQNFYAECMREGGILLVQPEHILSFKLMGVDRLVGSSSSNTSETTSSLQNMQHWLYRNARDILDESDEILHVRYQLVYTLGEQKPLEGHPERWTTTQLLLLLVAKHMRALKKRYPQNIGYEARPNGQFPILCIMPESDIVVAELLELVASDVLAGDIANLNFGLLSLGARKAISRLLIHKNLPEGDFAILRELDASVQSGLLLLRGLLACGIIVFALRDRHYRVDYGLHLSRSLLAVPYQAKDMPSLRAEFGHPDVAIVLTCLSYYYHGLEDHQLEICFESIYKLDNPNLEYEQWVHGNRKIHSQLRQLDGINLKDREQFIGMLLPAFARNSAVINFFMSSVVFPKSAKQFPFKLSASGWDLAEVKHHVTTGFSGTNDNQYLLPASITQFDPVKQSSTNALVLTYLLQPENNHYLRIDVKDGKKCSAKEYLGIIVAQDPEIRILLDVGAQMLDLQNDELVKHWLELRPDISAAVYFDDRDELVVVPQHGSPVAFFSSPYAQQLDKCVVYLDDGHTRGTDLDLPRQTRAAVTLGPKVTKDRLIQGCMRMRKLGHGQSVIFFAPSEIDTQIRKAANLVATRRVDTVDVLRWVMLETCKDLEHHVSHWAQQGIEYNRRASGLNALSGGDDIDAIRANWILPEYKSLQDTYGATSSTSSGSGSFTSQALSTPGLKERLNSLGIHSLTDPSMSEEQEREVSHEVEQERQVERPIKSFPTTHIVHEGVRSFIQTGVIPRGLTGFVSLFCPISIYGFPKLGTWSPKLLASIDFHRVIFDLSASRKKPSDYMRPINWIVSGLNGTLVALSPYEANELISEIRESRIVRLHVYAPQVTQSMASFSDLRFHTLPALSSSGPSPIDDSSQIQLNLFAGQLYLDSYKQYRSLCAFLGIYFETSNEEDDEIHVQSDGFVIPDIRQKLGKREPQYAECGFQASPIIALRELIGHRRKGMEYLRTHVGRVLHARQLTPDNF